MPSKLADRRNSHSKPQVSQLSQLDGGDDPDHKKWGRSQTYCPMTLDKQTCRNVAFFVCLFGIVWDFPAMLNFSEERVINPGSDFSTSDFPVPPVVP